MKLYEARENFYQAADTASQVARQLALAGIAVFWLLSGGLHPPGGGLSTGLFYAGLALSVAVFLDLFQFLWKASAWAFWSHLKENALEKADPKKKNYDNEEVHGIYPWVNKVTWTLLFSKVALIITAFVLLLIDYHSRT
ncbi:hypothetical protein AB0A05_34855 [Streptomyces sp. NPDC046374]|uniref:hypothetical protein n=1 Tax=Streptomyces sp. NPDC046374 TaxID=3154917 RepID=UPI0033D6B69F